MSNNTITATTTTTNASSTLDYIDIDDLKEFSVVSVYLWRFHAKIHGELFKTGEHSKEFLVSSGYTQNYIRFTKEQIDFVGKYRDEITIYLRH
ncbi:MAG: hypothetical protein FJY85_14525 [Deltaproteobacteria bacterium]|nr:hypothetical protein [Deltaproteobacteria bacterium]